MTTHVSVGGEEVRVPPGAITVSRDTVRAVDAVEKRSWSSGGSEEGLRHSDDRNRKSFD